MHAPFMAKVARGLAARGIRVVRFEFPYMAARREGKKTGAPDREPVLLETWRSAIREHAAAPRIFIGGKSLGGRMATMVADEMNVAGVVCFGYPFHPPGQPQKLRTKHLEALRTPALILQGERDPFGRPDEVAAYALSKSIRIEWLPAGDHSFKPREEENIARAVELAAEFMSR